MPDTPKPDATRPAFRLRAALAVPAGWPPDVAPNQIITAAHINSIKASVYAWPGDVDGQNHTLSNVHLANATGVLADPTTAAGDLIARGASAIGAFPIGGAGQVLTVDLALPQKLKWATPAAAPVLSFNTRTGAVMPQAGDYTAAMVTGALADPLTTKGDMIARGAVTGRMPVGLDGQILRADSASAPFGLRWGSESVPSVFGRSGAPVVAQAGDYTASQVTNAVSTIATYPDPAWITSLSWAKLIGTPASFPPAAHTHDAAAIVSGVLATARLGTGVANNTVYLRGDGTWAAAGTGGGGGVVSVFGRAGTVIAQAGDYTPAMVGAIPDNLLTSTGDLLVRNNVNQTTRLPIGANGQVLQTDLATSVGMKWTTISASVQTPWVTNIDAANFDLVNVHRLGVALAVPNYAVDVVGDVNYTGVLRSNGVPVVFGGSQTPWTQNINASGFSLNNAGTVGIGVAAPQSAPIQVATHTPGIAGSVAVQDLDATTAGNPVLLVTGLGSEGTRAWAVGNRGGATYGKDLYVWNDRASAMLFGTNSAERMRITAAGLVGIGRTPATYPLEVQGDVSVTGTYRINGVPIATSQTPWLSNIDGANFRLANVGGIGIGIASALYQFQVRIGGDQNIIFTQSAGLTSLQATNDAVSVYVPMKYAASAHYFTDGNVAIGTVNPGYSLTVQKSGAAIQSCIAVENATGGIYGAGIVFRPTDTVSTVTTAGRIYGVFDLPSFAASRISIQTMTAFETYQDVLTCKGSNVGIGTTNPGAVLSTGQNVVAPIKVATFDQGPGSTNAYGIGVATSQLTFGANINATSGTPQMVLTAGGRLGIGNTNPAYVLDVSGDVNTSGMFRVAGAPAGTISSWAGVSGSRALNGVYQNPYGKPMFISVYVIIAANSYIKLLTDGGNPPTFATAAFTNAAGGATTAGGSVSGWVMPGCFYKVESGGGTLQNWVEWV